MRPDAGETLGPWRFAAATQTGTSHLREGSAGQDRYRCAVVDVPGGSVFIVAASDGAGSAALGSHGAEYVCGGLVNSLTHELGRMTAGGADGWLSRCVEDTRRGLLAEADRLAVPARELASTLLCAVVTEHWSAFAQIGDGAIVTSERGTGLWSYIFWPQRGEYANTTSFLTDEAAMDSLEVAVRPQRLEEVAVFTDGLQHMVLHYERQSVHDPFFETMFRPVRRSLARGEDRELSAGLERYLGSPTVTDRTDDDVTLVMASRLAEAPGHGQAG